jgi:IS5 family transposase
VVLDTTVRPTAIAHTTDSRLLNKAREQRWTRRGTPASPCARATPAWARRLRTWLGRVIRDVQRKGSEITGELKTKIGIAQHL